jgi:hypothetical protein
MDRLQVADNFFPYNISPSRIDGIMAFTYGGDRWLASTNGGAATRLTAHPGVEAFAKFPPDGKMNRVCASPLTVATSVR